jgi:hypothetical protein
MSLVSRIICIVIISIVSVLRLADADQCKLSDKIASQGIINLTNKLLVSLTMSIQSDPGAAFTTLLFLHFLQIGPMR